MQFGVKSSNMKLINPTHGSCPSPEEDQIKLPSIDPSSVKSQYYLRKIQEIDNLLPLDQASKKLAPLSGKREGKSYQPCDDWKPSFNFEICRPNINLCALVNYKKKLLKKIQSQKHLAFVRRLRRIWRNSQKKFQLRTAQGVQSKGAH